MNAGSASALALLSVMATVSAADARPARGVATAISADTVHVAAPMGEREADRASILAALEQAPPGGTVHFAAGTYLIGEMIGVPTPRVTLLGHADGTVIRGCEPDAFPAFPAALLACHGFELSGAHQTVRNLTFEYTWHGLYVGCCFPTDEEALQANESAQRIQPGGHLIEGNTFRYAPNGIRVIGESPEPTVIRNNTFIDVYHAIGINGRTVHFLDNHIFVRDPGRVPIATHPGGAINVTPFGGDGDHTSCANNIIAGNRIEGHPEGIGIWLDSPATSCRNNTVRDNTIRTQRVSFTTSWFGIRFSDEADSTLVGLPLFLYNGAAAKGLTTEPGQEAFLEDNVLEGNRIMGAEGLGIHLVHASRNRIVDNLISAVRPRNPFPGNDLHVGNPPGWSEANGSAILISAGSDENEIIGNTFEDIASYAIVLESDRNRVETRNSADAVRDLGSGNQVTPRDSATARRANEAIGIFLDRQLEEFADTVHVAPPVGEREADRASILAAVERLLPGGIVQFAPGTYIVGRLIRIATPGITLLGHPDGTTLHGCEAGRFDDVGRDMAATWLGELGPDESLASVEGCDIFELTGGHATVRGLTFERAWSGLLLGCCEAEFQIRPTDGGYLIEDNLFRNIMNGVRATLWAPEPTVIRHNRFVNTFHAVVWFGSRLHMFDNHVSVPEPARLSVIGFPAIAIGVFGGTPPRPATLPAAEYTAAVPCDENVIGGNHVEGHPDGITLVAFPGPSCRHNVVRDNTIVVSTPSFDRSQPAGRSFGADDTAPSVITGVPLSLFAVPDQDGRSGGVEESVVEGNRVAGAHGVGIELVRASGNRIANNTITGIRSRNPFPGNVVGTVPEWADANGAGIWVSGGSDENEVVGNTFEDIGSHTIVLEGDRNRVQPRSASDAVLDLGSGNQVRTTGQRSRPRRLPGRECLRCAESSSGLNTSSNDEPSSSPDK